MILDCEDVFVSIGANLPRSSGSTPIDTCRWAVSAIDVLPGVRVRALSRWYRTAPVPPSGQPDFVNAVVHLTVDRTDSINPATLLACLLAIEQAGERARNSPNGARTLDLDIISFGTRAQRHPDPVLPHPRAHLRAFVLLPLFDVSPDWVHPVTGRTIDAMLAKLPDQKVEALPA